jgi:hypothetical protein
VLNRAINLSENPQKQESFKFNFFLYENEHQQTLQLLSLLKQDLLLFNVDGSAEPMDTRDPNPSTIFRDIWPTPKSK